MRVRVRVRVRLGLGVRARVRVRVRVRMGVRVRFAASPCRDGESGGYWATWYLVFPAHSTPTFLPAN